MNKNLREQLDSFIRRVGSDIKFKVGKIKYNIKIVNTRYEDKDDMKINDHTYVKRI